MNPTEDDKLKAMRAEVATIDHQIEQAAYNGDVYEYERLTSRRTALHQVIHVYHQRLQDDRDKNAAYSHMDRGLTWARKRVAELREIITDYELKLSPDNYFDKRVLRAQGRLSGTDSAIAHAENQVAYDTAVQTRDHARRDLEASKQELALLEQEFKL